VGVYAKGKPTAKIAIIEFSDLECPFCAQYHRQAFPLIDKQYVQAGLVRYGFRHLPIDQLHPSARRAAEATECAGVQGKLWEYQARVFSNQQMLSVADLIGHARATSLDVAQFQPCLLDGQMASRVATDVQEGQNLGLTGTPAFLLGTIESNGTVRISRKIVGAQPFPTFQSALDGLLNETGRQ